MGFTANCIVIRKIVKVNFFTTDGKKKKCHVILTDNPTETFFRRWLPSNQRLELSSCYVNHQEWQCWYVDSFKRSNGSGKKIISSTHENWTPEDTDTLNAAKIFLEF